MQSAGKIREAFLVQAEHCEHLGSPFMTRLCRLLADRLTEGAPVGDAISHWPGDISSAGDSVPLRLAGALHALVLLGRHEGLAAVYPPKDDALDDDTLWNGVNAALSEESDFILEWMKSPPQTNEVRRSAALLPGFLTVAEQTGLPLMMSEVGASAGLNLLWDKFHYQLGDMSWGDEMAAVHLKPEWEGPEPPQATLSVVGRAGCDLQPLNPADEADRLRLRSYLWADQAERVALTTAALDLAADAQAPVEPCDALVWLERRLAIDTPKLAHVVYHSVAWQYLPPEAQARGAEMIAEAGARATESAPLAWLRMEADGKAPGAALTLTLWPSGEEHVLGRADFHCRWVKWQGLAA
ncbi:DUF2332 domain-containing protein [Kordiimonas marina]|uniref:DUF2332 domain-containing protein n=1 Tax=Kordiimonas marina TaxID=2872312 RepID=UPI001FF6BB4D|nr:DUF2332 family protein [Kordiimonas marina]MCJ9428773.1 DUF2332 family protein [Kordiimonas marina]